jgi:hypothetical protein
MLAFHALDGGLEFLQIIGAHAAVAFPQSLLCGPDTGIV